MLVAREYESDVRSFLQDLVRIPSVNGVNSETTVARRIMQEAEKLKLGARLIGEQEARLNVLVELGAGEPGFGFVGHMDTVAAGQEELWDHPPFEGEVSDGVLYGRGAADNKAGIACAVYTLALLRDHDWLQPDLGRLLVAGVVDEESGANSPLGVRFLLDQGYLGLDAAIYTYTSDVICIGHRGLLRLELQASGKSIHSGSMEWDRGEFGVNAVTGLASILVKLEALDLGATPHTAFPGLSGKITPGTLISGGDWEGMVPGWANAVVDIRLLPNQSPDQVRKVIESIVEEEMDSRPGFQVEIQEKARLPAAVIPEDHKLVNLAKSYTREVTGETWQAVGAGPANEGYMLIEAGIPTLPGFGPTGGNAHTENEWVEIASLAPTMAMFAGIAHDYLISMKE